MSAHLEIEQRYQLTQTQAYDLLEKIEFVSQKRVLDVYFDTLDGSYYQNGVFIRVRNGKSLDIKFNPNHLNDAHATEHVICAEYNFREPFNIEQRKNFRELKEMIGLKLPEEPTIEGLLLINKLNPLLTIDKLRKTYRVDDFEIILDIITGLDPILEIEYIGSQNTNKSQKDIVSEMEQLIAPLGLTSLRTGSFEMLLRKKDFDLYKKGKYLLEEDRAEERRENLNLGLA